MNLKLLLLIITLMLFLGTGIVIGYMNGYAEGEYVGYNHGFDEGEIWDSGYSDGYVAGFEINDKDKWMSKLTYLHHYNNSVWAGWESRTHPGAEESYNLIIERGK